MLWEMPAGHGKSFIMLFVSALLLTLAKIKKIKIVYHEQDILTGDQQHIDTMKRALGAE